MMTRKRRIAAGAVLVLLCLASCSLGVVYLARTVPGVARLFHGVAAEPTAIPVGASQISLALHTATLTPTPTQAATKVQPSPTVTPSATATDARPITPAEPTATMLSIGTDTPTLTWTATLAPTWTGSSTPVPPTATPRPHWIAFESQRGANSDYEIVAMATDGSRQTNLTNSWADDVAPVWAPDGRGIAFLSFRDTIAGKWGLGKGSIYAMSFEPATGTGGEVWRITDDGGADDWPSWSPDGTRIAFQSDRSGNPDIWLVTVDGSGLVQLTHHPADDLHPDWSSDGKKIAFTSKRSGNADVWVLDVEAVLQSGDDASAIDLTNSPGVDRYPFWSPNDMQLTFSSERDGNKELYVMNADGSAPHNVSQSPDSTEGLAGWSPDGKRLVFYSDRSGNKEVYILDLASLAWTNISNNPASDEFCTWSP